MNDVEEILSEIRNIGQWYYKLKPGYTDINKLQDKRRIISSLYSFLSDHVGRVHAEYIEINTHRKVEYLKIRRKSKEPTQAAKESEAEFKTIDIRENEAMCEANWRRLQVFLKGCEDLSSSIGQQISTLKKDENNRSLNTATIEASLNISKAIKELKSL